MLLDVDGDGELDAGGVGEPVFHVRDEFALGGGVADFDDEGGPVGGVGGGSWGDGDGLVGDVGAFFAEGFFFFLDRGVRGW